MRGGRSGKTVRSNNDRMRKDTVKRSNKESVEEKKTVKKKNERIQLKPQKKRRKKKALSFEAAKDTFRQWLKIE